MSQDEIVSTVQAEYGAIQRCLGKLNPATAPDELQVRLSVLAKGSVGSATIIPTLVDTPVQRCLQTTLRGIRFRPGPADFEFVLPLKIQKPQ
jgi:hypothetical protein